MENPGNRWMIVVGGIMVNLMLGVTYTWSVFGSALEKNLGWARPDQMMAFSIMLLFFAVMMPIAGRLQDKKGPRHIALIGGVLLGLGFLASSLALNNNILMYISYGILAGSGVGFAYNAPIAAGSKWFPDKRGLVMGLMVFGFGFGSVLLAPMAEVLINNVPKTPTGLIQPVVVAMFGLPGLSALAGIGIANTFLLLGALFIAIVSAGAMLLKNPPAGWKPEGWDPSKVKKAVSHAYKDFEFREMIKTRQFWMLWLMFTLSAGAGLTIIGFLKNLAAACFENAHQFTKESAGLEGAIVVSVFAIFNGVGRIFAGWLSDRIGRTRAMFLFFGLQAVLVSTLISTTTASPLVVYVVMALVGMCFGSNFALFPSATADFFGTKNVGVNYGMMFTAYGVGGLLGPTMFANMLPEKPVFGDYSLPLLIIGVLVGVAAIMAFLTKPPEQTKG